MEITVPDGTPVLQAAFYILAAVIVVAAIVLLGRAALASGDSIIDARALQRRFTIWSAAWISVVSAASYAGLLLPRRGPPLPFALMVAGVILCGILLARSRFGDRFARGLPLGLLVGFQAFRLPLELAMHRAYTKGVMPEQMSYSGRNFDIVTGITALLLGIALMSTRVPRAVIQVWNVLGLVLLVNIVTVAIMSAPMFAYFGPDRLNVFVMKMPYTLLPAVMVLAAWAGHLIIFRALAQPSRSIHAGSSM